MSDNRERIMTLAGERAKEGETFTKAEACKVVYYYANTAKHCGDVLTRLVRAGKLDRVRRGVYRLRDPLGMVGPPTPVQQTPIDDLPLFGRDTGST